MRFSNNTVRIYHVIMDRNSDCPCRFMERPMDESATMAPSFSTSGRTDSMSSLSSVSTVSSDAAMMHQAQVYQQHQQQQQQQSYQHSLTQKTTTTVSETGLGRLIRLILQRLFPLSIHEAPPLCHVYTKAWSTNVKLK